MFVLSLMLPVRDIIDICLYLHLPPSTSFRRVQRDTAKWVKRGSLGPHSPSPCPHPPVSTGRRNPGYRFWSEVESEDRESK